MFTTHSHLMVKHTGYKDAHWTQILSVNTPHLIAETVANLTTFLSQAQTRHAVFYFGIRIRTKPTRSHPWEFIYIHLFPLLMYYYSLLPKTEASLRFHNRNEYTVEVGEQSNCKSLKNRFIKLVRIQNIYLALSLGNSKEPV